MSFRLASILFFPIDLLESSADAGSIHFVIVKLGIQKPFGTSVHGIAPHGNVCAYRHEGPAHWYAAALESVYEIQNTRGTEIMLHCFHGSGRNRYIVVRTGEFRPSRKEFLSQPEHPTGTLLLFAISQKIRFSIALGGEVRAWRSDGRGRRHALPRRPSSNIPSSRRSRCEVGDRGPGFRTGTGTMRPTRNAGARRSRQRH